MNSRQKTEHEIVHNCGYSYAGNLLLDCTHVENIFTFHCGCFGEKKYWKPDEIFQVHYGNKGK